MIKKILYTICTVLIIGMLYVATVRGNLGNPTPTQIERELSDSGRAFETSQERSRYALILSLYNYHTFNIDHYASMGTPDIGRINNHYYSFFPPGASIIAYPFYHLGRLLGVAQIAVFSVSTLFAILTMGMIVLIVRKLKLHWSTALFSAVAFAFATNAWGYSVTFYAHLISAFFITLSVYLVGFLDSKKALKLSFFWVIYSIAVYVDFPNLFIFLPMAILAFGESFRYLKDQEKIKLKINLLFLFLPLIFIGLMLAYGAYNKTHFGNYTTLSNAIPRVKDLKDVNLSVPEKGKDVAGALNTRNMLEGLRSFTVSPDRGIIKYSPIVLLSFLAFGYLKGKRKNLQVLLFGVPLTCLTLYTMFGDPYGGWAFGSRYMLAVFPPLCILGGIGLQRYADKIGVKVLFSFVFMYSTAVSLLAPLTTNVIPPVVEASGLGLKSDYTINLQMLSDNTLNSFLYNSIFSKAITGFEYYYVLLAVVSIFGLTLIWFRREKNG